MADYWNNRYLQTLLKVEQAQSSQTRSAYCDLAAHYKAMRQLCEHSPLLGAYREAA